MGIDFDNLKNKADDLLKQHGDKIEDGVEKAGEFAKSKLGHDETVDKVVDKIQDMIPGEHGNRGGEQPGGEQQGGEQQGGEQQGGEPGNQ